MALNVFRFAPTKFIGYMEKIKNEKFKELFKDDDELYK